MGHYKKISTRLGIVIVVLILSICSLYILFLLSDNSQELKVSFLNVGQGDAILIQSPSGRQVLVDAGKDDQVVERLFEVMPYLDRHIDFFLATHPDLDHIGGFPFLLERFTTSLFIHSGISSDNTVDHITKSKLAEKNIPTQVVRRGDVFYIADGVYIYVLSPQEVLLNAESNESSVILKIVYGSVQFLLTGDASVENELALVGADRGVLKSTVLKLGHHGSDTSTHDAFLEHVDPEYVIVSAGKNNTYRHPHPSVISRVRLYTEKIISTSEYGTITFATDGKAIRVLPQIPSSQSMTSE